MSVPLRQYLLLIALAMLGVRALTPLGYMPASAGTGLLYELCPDGMPAEVMHALAGGGHHHHGGGGKGGASESCPIGHMLTSAVANDIDISTVVIPEPEVFMVPSVVSCDSRARIHYRCRSPPA